MWDSQYFFLILCTLEESVGVWESTVFERDIMAVRAYTACNSEIGTLT